MVDFPACALGKLAVGGDLSVTRVERSVTLDPNEAIPGPEYGEPVVHTDTHEVRLVFPGARLPAAQNGAIQLSPLVWVPPPLGAGIFKALGSFDPMRIWEAAQEVRSGAADQRLDEHTRLSLGMGCIPAEPHFRFTWRSSL